MKRPQSKWLAAVLALLVAAPALAGSGDVWIATRAKTALLTAAGLRIRGVDVASVDGAVTLHGIVRTQAEKENATLALRGVAGVTDVRNLLRVVPDAWKPGPRATDAAIRDGVATALSSDKRFEGVTVSSVSNGVVLLSGRASSLAERLRAIELAWNVGGVSRVASEIETAER